MRLITSIIASVIIPFVINILGNAVYGQQLLNKTSLTGERIFFVKKHQVGDMRLGDLYSIKADGTDLIRLTNFSQNYAGAELPQLSGDGTKLAFVSNYESWKSINYIDAFLADLVTGEIRRITGYEKLTPATAYANLNVTVNDPNNFALTPSAIRISYMGCSSFVTGNSATLTVPAGEEIWVKAELAKAKGDHLTFTLAPNSTQNVTLDLLNGTLSAESCSPSFNGNILAVSENSEAVSNAEGQTFAWYKILLWDTNTGKEISEVGGYKMGAEITPAFSPNDNFLAMCTGEQSIQSLGLIPTSNLSAAPTLLAYGNILGYHAYCTSPAWSPDGSEIVYVYVIITTSFIGTELSANIYKVSVNGGNPVKLTNFSGREVATKPSYSPDGSRIAFTYSKSNGTVFTLNDFIFGNYTSDIHSISSSGGNETAITNDGNSLDPSWGIIGNAVGIEKDQNNLAQNFELYQNYPNPFNPSTTIKYSIPMEVKSEKAEVRSVIVKVFDILGREVATLVNEKKAPGNYQVEFNSNSSAGNSGFDQNPPSGIYFYTLTSGSLRITKKMVFLK